MVKEPTLAVEIGGIKLKNPVMVAAGTFGYGKEYAPLVNIRHLGAIITKGISLRPHKGNRPPRIVETTGGILNSIGLENVGLEVFLKEKLPYLQRFGVPVIVNLFGNSLKEYSKLARRLNDIPGISGLEANISCPNIRKGGLSFGRDPKMAAKLVRKVRKSTTLPLMVKFSPNVTDITSIAQSVADSGADSISLINTLTGMAIDILNKTPKLGGVTGGLSGPCIKPIAIHLVWRVAQRVKIPVIGIGGIVTASDALEFIIAGARAVQVGTANFLSPVTCQEIVKGIKDYLKENKISDINELVGSLRI